MTSQRDETTHAPAGQDMTDDPIVIERRDGALTGDSLEGDSPEGDALAGDRLADGVPAGEGPGHDPGAEARPGSDRPGYDRPGSDRPGYDRGYERPGYEPDGHDRPGAGGAAEDEMASDDLIGRHPAPDTGGADPAPLVVPPDVPRAETAGSSASGPAAAAGAPAAVAQPGVDGTADPAVPSPAGAGEGSLAAGTSGNGVPAAALSEQQWPAIQAMFVDDPQGSVQRAAAAAEEVAKAFVASLQREQAALRASWETGGDTTTEDLRTALQQYRAFCSRLTGSQPG